MRFLFEAADADSRGIRIIPEIPDIRLARVEGKNGIGKTLAARLLELVSGGRPFAALPRAWESLVELLGVVKITIEGHPEGPLIIDIDSKKWRGRSEAECAAEPGDARLAGEPIDWIRLRQLIQVQRIAGDEGLAETLGRTVRERALEADAGRRRIGDLVESWSHRLDTLRVLCGGIGPELLDTARRNAQQAEDEYEKTREDLSKAEELADAWSEARTILRSLSQFAHSYPALMAAYAAGLDKHHNASEQIKQLEQRLAQAGVAAAIDDSRRKDIAKWTRLLDLRETALTRARLQERRVLGYLGIDTRPILADVRKLRTETNNALREAEAELRTADMAGTIRSATTNIEGMLDELPEPALAETIADLDRPVTASQLLVGVRQRRAHLDGVPRPGEAVQLSRKIDDLRDRVSVLAQVPNLIEITDRKARNVNVAQETLISLMGLSDAEREEREATQLSLSEQRDLMVAGSAEAVATLSRLYALIGAPVPELEPSTTTIDESSEEQDESELSAAEGELSSAVQLLLRTPDAVQEEVNTWKGERLARLAQLQEITGVNMHFDASMASGTDTDNLRASVEAEETAAAQRVQELSATLAVATEHRTGASAALVHMRLSIASAVRSLLIENEWESLRPAIERALARAGISASAVVLSEQGFLHGGDSVDVAAAEMKVATVLQDLAKFAEQIEDSAATVRDAWASTTAYLDNETRRLARRLADAEPDRFTANSMSGPASVVLRSWTEVEIGRILSSTALREQLFNNAETVHFDLEGLAVQWRTLDGKRRRRPLEAFSSGEQVFAYTRAKLETLRDLKSTSQYVVVFLDEFGAFVARDRFSELMRYVQDDVLGDIADQVVVMLPTSSSDEPLTLREELDGVFHAEGYVVTSAEPERVG